MNLGKNRSRNFFKILFLFIFVATFTFLAFKLPQETSATRGEFKAGNIISDYMMSKFDTMSVAEIQTFLNEKGNCNNTETYMASWYPSVHYHTEGGRYVCLANERFATSGTNYGDLLSDGEASQTAAEIIYEVAQEYKINPQVLLVLLEKEQGLISDSWPNSLQYRSATGYGCPDTAACDSKYYGFKNQLKNAAGLFRTVLNGGWTNYPVGENWIYYNPNYDCGGSTVYVENLATSALYRYTPYQPNAAALSVGYGTAYCGAYGNRNFSYLFWDWFGDPTSTAPIQEQTGTKLTREKSIEKENLENRYEELKEKGLDLGYPRDEVFCYTNSKNGKDYCVQWYDNGYIISGPNGAWESYGEIRKRWSELGYENGVLGYPAGPVLVKGSKKTQKYDNGVIEI